MDGQNAALVRSNSTPGSQLKLNLAAVKNLNLFGDFNGKPISEKVVTTAPVTRLSLILTGVVASSLKDQGAAIIANRNIQQTYGVGEKIDGTNATLQMVYADRVIIKNGLTNETLMLDGEDFNKQFKGATAPPASSPSPNNNKTTSQRRTLSESALVASKKLRQQPTNFIDFISISPHRPNGQLLGYRVRPGKDPSLFKEAGLIAGDVITEINGLDLTSPQQALEAMNMLKNIESLQMTVQRRDDLMTINLDLPEGDEGSQK
jgi:general secretion pathway protein C